MQEQGPEPDPNPNSRFLVDPPGWLRRLMTYSFSRVTDPGKTEKRRRAEERNRIQAGAPHRVEYFHQLDDPYSHLTAQIIQSLTDTYDIELITHLIPASGGKNQPESGRLARLARHDAELIAPYFNLGFPGTASTMPDQEVIEMAGAQLAGMTAPERITNIKAISTALWEGDARTLRANTQTNSGYDEELAAGSERLSALGHYSGATFYYAGEWYWGVDRLFHLERRLQGLGVSRNHTTHLLAPRPDIDVSDTDASGLTLDFYPSLNSPYTSIIYDRVIALKNACGIRFNHKPVLPMIMRGVPITRNKGQYIMFDTKREADYAGVPFGKIVTPIGGPTRKAYALLPWAFSIGKDEDLMSSMLRHAFAMGVGLHTRKGFRRAVEAAGLDWTEATKHLHDQDWKPMIAGFQKEMAEELDLWGVPSFRLSGPDGTDDLIVWGQDRLWLVAAEIRRRAESERS